MILKDLLSKSVVSHHFPSKIPRGEMWYIVRTDTWQYFRRESGKIWVDAPALATQFRNGDEVLMDFDLMAIRKACPKYGAICRSLFDILNYRPNVRCWDTVTDEWYYRK